MADPSKLLIFADPGIEAKVAKAALLVFVRHYQQKKRNQNPA